MSLSKFVKVIPTIYVWDLYSEKVGVESIWGRETPQ